ncbi:MAG: hypothetical protein A2252_00975 [Elusimicrobia bacterium RIFOXYA2_FULL_39_19]|nr:MAG: hypothetical protein A2252_00975 [Elusimicrobia bacterium RIFOXYA2_FULL_39_19]
MPDNISEHKTDIELKNILSALAKKVEKEKYLLEQALLSAENKIQNFEKETLTQKKQFELEKQKIINQYMLRLKNIEQSKVFQLKEELKLIISETQEYLSIPVEQNDEQIRTLEKDILNLQDILANLQEEIVGKEKLKIEIIAAHSSEREYSEIQNEHLTTLKNEKQSFETEKVLLEKRKIKLIDLGKSSELGIEDLEKQIKILEKEYYEETRDITTLENHIREHEGNIEVYEQNIDKINFEKGLLLSIEQLRNKNIANIIKEKEKIETIYEEKREEIKAIQKKHEKKDTNLKTLKQRIRNANELNEISKKLENEIENLEENLKILKEDLEAIISNKSALNKRLSKNVKKSG